MTVDSSIVYLYSTDNPVLMQLIRIRLDEAGIESEVYDDSISGLYHITSLASRIMVQKRHLARAKNIIYDIEEEMNNQNTDFDFKEADHEDIAYEKEVYQDEIRIKNAKPKFLILILIIAFLVFFYLILTFS